MRCNKESVIRECNKESNKSAVLYLEPVQAFVWDTATATSQLDHCDNIALLHNLPDTAHLAMPNAYGHSASNLENKSVYVMFCVTLLTFNVRWCAT